MPKKNKITLKLYKENIKNRDREPNKNKFSEKLSVLGVFSVLKIK